MQNPTPVKKFPKKTAFHHEIILEKPHFRVLLHIVYIHCSLMKYSGLLLPLAAIGTLTSCFKDEPLNAECDIEQAYVHLDAPYETFFSLADTLKTVPSDQSQIVFTVRKGADLSALAPCFTLTPEATVTPESGSTHDFSDGKTVLYTVTSEDKQWKRQYTVGFKAPEQVSEYSFENFKLDDSGKYYVWSDIDSEGNELNNWATGNPGFKLAKGSAAPEEYPTAPVDDGVSGHAVKLTTRSTGMFGQLVKRPIAAGNLFIGFFDISKALTETLKATNFGLSFARKPVKFSGWYKYRRGDTFTGPDGQTIASRVDAGDIYAVFYRNKDSQGNAVMLYGDDVRTNKNIIALAELGTVSDTDGWTHFEVEFKYSGEVDQNALQSQGYSLAIVCTSSTGGADFEGAAGSTLYVDELNITCEESE